MQIMSVSPDAPRMQRALAFLASLFACPCSDAPRELEHPAKPNINPARHPGAQQLGPKQLAWLEQKYPYFGIHRAQAEAPTGVAVVQPEQRS